MRYFLKKLSSLIITLLVISLLSFVAFSVIPGDAALSKLGTNATTSQIEQLREQYGLDKPLPERYVNWLSGAVRGDFGDSYRYSTKTVAELIGSRLPVTVIMAVMSFIIIIGVSIPLGIIAAKYSHKPPDTVINVGSQVTMAIPSFFLGIIITYIFGIILNLFKAGDYISPQKDFWACVRYLIFPSIAVALPKIAMVIKYLRNSLLAEVDKDYVRTAYSKGNTKDQVFKKHIFRNAMIPVITFVAMVVAEILAGSLVIEQVFGIKGMGNLLVTSITARDYPVVQAAVLYITSIVVIINFAVDIFYQLADPRVRYS